MLKNKKWGEGYFFKERDHLNIFLGNISTNVLGETGVEAKLGCVGLRNEKIYLERLGQRRDG